MLPDHQTRLTRLFDAPGLVWIRKRLRERIRQGKGLGGSIMNTAPDEQEIAAFTDLLGKPSRNRKQLSLKLATLENLLQEAEIATSLEQAIFMLEGPVENIREQQAQQDKRWNQLHEHALASLASNEVLISWLVYIQSNGLLKRLSGSDPDRAEQLLNQAIALLKRLPENNIPLPSLAALITGDSHALDIGKPLAGLLLPALARLSQFESWQTPSERRALWSSVGVLCDALSQPVLTHNLCLSKRHPLASLLHNGFINGEPSYLTTRQLMRYPIESPQDCRFDHVYICGVPA